MPTPAGNVPDHLAPTVRRVVYLPVNRPFEAAFHSVAAEVASLEKSQRDNVTLLVVDDCAPPVSRANRQVTERVARESGLRVHTLDQQGWRRLATTLIAASGLTGADRATAQTALVKPTGSYGAGPNKAALVAALEGAVSLHRRDSDQITTVDPDTGASPLRLEADLLSRARPEGGAAAYCAGSFLTGRPTRDRRDLERDSTEYAARIDALSQLPFAPARHPPLPPVRERAALLGGQHAERDLTGVVEMGIAAMRSVYEWIPEMPAVGILGSDYFQKGLLYQLDLPVFHHSLPARHTYESWRTEQRDDSHLAWYVRAEVRYAVLRRHWNSFNHLLVAERARVLSDGHFDSRAYGELFVEALHEGARGAESIPDDFVAVYRDAANAATGEVRRRLLVRLAGLEEETGAVNAYVAGAIHEFAALSRLWPGLISAAQRVGRTTALETFTH
ncbi:hypothetical protein ADK56_08235 [Streptomyces sp. MMG1522]|uniref:DUF6271 family protein n=1 Tax=Streptomyces sp. MMG1522 TaxID=1415545 RepID=UPI0006ADB518|nr:DUF6271 family protein [Streptomyces sp. MMG1522]KOU51795.1 hypothetical protein ADK56_08235 [Streptomyces sp. MMG1522]